MRKAGFFHTTYFDQDLGFFVKESDPHGYSHLLAMHKLYNNFVKKYRDLVFTLVPSFLVSEVSIGFSPASGVSLSEYVTSDYSFVRENLLGVIDALPQGAITLHVGDQIFSQLLGRFKSFFGGTLVFGLLDISDSNVFVDDNGHLSIIDYEWYLDGGVPKNFINYRAAINLYYRHEEYLLSEGMTLLRVMKDLRVKRWLEPFYYYWEKNFQATILLGSQPNFGIWYGISTVVTRYFGLFFKLLRNVLPT